MNDIDGKISHCYNDCSPLQRDGVSQEQYNAATQLMASILGAIRASMQLTGESYVD